MRTLHEIGYSACPHSAVAYGVLKRRLEAGETGVFLATAHAAKFPEVVAQATGAIPGLPPALAALEQSAILSFNHPNEAESLKARLRSLCRG